MIVLDLGLPDLDSVEVCKRIRTWSHTPIVVLSADSTEDRKVEALDAGADDYVTKPFGMREFNARLRVALRGPGYENEVNYLKVYAYRVRRKLGDEEGHFLQSDPSVGYRLARSTDHQSGGLLIRGFGDQVPGGAPVLTWRFYCSVSERQMHLSCSSPTYGQTRFVRAR